jgi:hypothetical protein
MRTFTDTVRGIAHRNDTSWRSAQSTSVATSGKAAECKRNITAAMITGEGTATTVITTTTTIMAETTTEGEVEAAVL